MESSVTAGILKTLKKTLRRWRRDADDYREFFFESRYPLPEENAMAKMGYIVRQAASRTGRAEAKTWQKENGLAGERLFVIPWTSSPVLGRHGKPSEKAEELDRAYTEIADSILNSEG